MSAKKIKPVINSSSGGKIKAPEQSVGNVDREPPIFCLKYIKKTYSVDDCTKDQKAAFADTLSKLSKLTWMEIRTGDKRGYGCEKLTIDKAKIPEHITADVDIIGIRFWNKARMVGYRDSTKRIFHIVWLDIRMNLYDHGS